MTSLFRFAILFAAAFAVLTFPSDGNALDRRPRLEPAVNTPKPYAPLPTLGDAVFGTPENPSRYRVTLIYLTTTGRDSSPTLIVRNPWLPGVIPADSPFPPGPNRLALDTLDHASYTAAAIKHYLESYSYGRLRVTVDTPMNTASDGTDTPVWVSADTAGLGVVDDVLAQVDTQHPDWFTPDSSRFDYHRVMYLSLHDIPELPFTQSRRDNSGWASDRGRAIWDGATAAVRVWSGTRHPLHGDGHTYTGINTVVHELLHHLPYAAGDTAGVLWDRGITDYGTRTRGFDIMDHNGIGFRERTNSHYGLEPLAPVDQYWLGFIGEERYREITCNTKNVTLAPIGDRVSDAPLLVRIPLSTGTESFLIANHQGLGIDAAFVAGLGTDPAMGDDPANRARGLEIWHIADGYYPGLPHARLRGSTHNTADVEVAWTHASGDTYAHPDRVRSWPVDSYLPNTYRDNIDWIDGAVYVASGRREAASPFYPPMAGPALPVLANAPGGWSSGTPDSGAAYCNYIAVGDSMRWVQPWDELVFQPLPRDLFGPGDAFTPYSRPNTDHYHRYTVSAARDHTECSWGGKLATPRTGSLRIAFPPPLPTRVALRDIVQGENGEIHFSVWFNWWEGAFSHPKNFNARNDGVWRPQLFAGVVHDTLVVGPAGFDVDVGRLLTITSGTTVLPLGDVRVGGSVTVVPGVVWLDCNGTHRWTAADTTRFENGVVLPRDLP